MELNIRNKWVSFAGSSVVKDVSENDVLKVKGRFFSMRKRKYVMDLNDKVLYQVRNRFWNFFKYCSYVFDAEGKVVASVRTKFFSLHDHLNVISDKGELTIIGNILGFDYHITLNGKEIGHVARRISLRDSYTLTLNDDIEDIYFYVALVIALDNIADLKRSGNESSIINSVNN